MVFSAKIPSTRAEAKRLKTTPSRKLSSPATASTSPLVRTTASIGLERTPFSMRGRSSSAAATCSRRSGEAFSNVHATPSALAATEAWVRARNPDLPSRTLRQLAQLQFSCGNPPPAAEPKTLMIMEARATHRRDNASGGSNGHRLHGEWRDRISAPVELGRRIACNLETYILLHHRGLVPFEFHALLPIRPNAQQAYSPMSRASARPSTTRPVV